MKIVKLLLRQLNKNNYRYTKKTPHGGNFLEMPTSMWGFLCLLLRLDVKVLLHTYSKYVIWAITVKNIRFVRLDHPLIFLFKNLFWNFWKKPKQSKNAVLILKKNFKCPKSGCLKRKISWPNKNWKTVLTSRHCFGCA